MDNEQFNQKFTVSGVIKYLERELSLDILRLIEYCNREIKRCNAELKLIPGNNPETLSPDDIQEAIAIVEGERRAYKNMKQQLERRLYTS